MTPAVSILIPSIPGRHNMAQILFADLEQQARGLPVEILMLCDNKARSIGAKRQALVDIAGGDYLGFVDDDDTVSDDYVEKIVKAAHQRPDVIVFDSLCVLGERAPALCRHDISFPNEQYSPDGFRRKPWHIHHWRRDITSLARFQDANYGEDWPWCEQMLRHVSRQVRASDTPLYTYLWNAAVTEAKP